MLPDDGAHLPQQAGSFLLSFSIQWQQLRRDFAAGDIQLRNKCAQGVDEGFKSAVSTQKGALQPFAI